MKKLLFLLLLTSSAIAQVGIATKDVKQLDNALFVRPKVLTISQLRTGSDTAPSLLITNKGQEGMFYLDPLDTSSSDNTGTILVNAIGKRYKRPSVGKLTFSWFGGTPAALTSPDNTAALQKAVNTQAKTGEPIIITTAGTYSFSNTITKAQSFTGLSIEAVDGTVFSYTGISGSAPLLKIVGGSGALTRSVISNITFNGNAKSVAIEIAGQCGQRISKCTFNHNLVGIRFHNEASKSFTEHCVGEDCIFNSNCKVVLHYKITSGNFSMHGNGLSGRNLINTTASTVIQVDDGTLPYNCPLNAQIWTHKGSCVLIQNNNTQSFKPTFFGQITVELFPPSDLTLAAGKLPTYFAGSVVSNGDLITGGNMVICESAVYKPNGTVVTHGARYNAAIPLTTGLNKLQSVPTKQGSYFVTVLIIGPNYDYRYLIQIQNEGSGNAGFLTTLSNQRSFNSAGWGAPTLAVDEIGNLLISNTHFPSSGLPPG
ncbi:hypothetical protein GO730_26205 [Spirosoma sp. HMF3257]|uniref:Pectate lyase superfamily protein domain-containing protein n=1 Tax=Spirosoma telluris TaxID=2183553 RepID=A0A327NMW5_9BACT|nr:hypothetical protein [Spirosoma telluris]RAI76781.1 hypothetical protein HMF3257_26140 [Spirosoma telluris]